MISGTAPCTCRFSNDSPRDGARLVFYDIVFDTAIADPARDDSSSRDALQTFGKADSRRQRSKSCNRWDGVRTGARFLRLSSSFGRRPPVGESWSSSQWMPTTACGRLFPGTSDIPSATWKAAEVLDAKATREPREAQRATLDQLLRTEEYLLLR